MAVNNRHVVATAPPLSDRPRHRSGVPLRVRALMRRRALDQALAAGEDATSSPELALRARQLTSRRMRRILADGFDGVLATADGKGPRRSSAPPVSGRQVRASRAALVELARALRYDEIVAPAGVAQAQRLLTDGAGPLYVDAPEGSLSDTARAANLALRPHL